MPGCTSKAGVEVAKYDEGMTLGASVQKTMQLVPEVDSPIKTDLGPRAVEDVLITSDEVKWHTTMSSKMHNPTRYDRGVPDVWRSEMCFPKKYKQASLFLLSTTVVNSNPIMLLPFRMLLPLCFNDNCHLDGRLCRQPRSEFLIAHSYKTPRIPLVHAEAITVVTGNRASGKT